MTREALRQQVLLRLSRQRPGQVAQIAAAIDAALEPYVTRDTKAAAAVDKAGNPAPQAPYHFNAQSVAWLEREALRRL